MGHFRTIFEHLKRYRMLLFLSLFLAAINQIFSLLDPLILRIIVDNYVVKFAELDRQVFVKGVLFLLAAAVGAAFVSRVAKNFQD